MLGLDNNPNISLFLVEKGNVMDFVIFLLLYVVGEGLSVIRDAIPIIIGIPIGICITMNAVGYDLEDFETKNRKERKNDE